MKSVPKVSVVMPAYNDAAFIGDAIESVLRQGYPDLEIIVVDDGSTDETYAVARSFGSPVRALSGANGGAAVARNKGINAASGNFIAFLDSDDVWFPGKLQAQMEYLRRYPKVGLCCTGFEVFSTDAGYPAAYNEPGEPLCDLTADLQGWLYHALLMDCVVWTSTVVARRSLLEEVGEFDGALRRGQDYDFWLRASRHMRMARLNAVLAGYRVDPGTGAKKFPNKNWELEVVQRALSKWGRRDPEGRQIAADRIDARLWGLNFGFGYTQFRAKRYLAARAAFNVARAYRRRHLKTALYLLASSICEQVRRRRAA